LRITHLFHPFSGRQLACVGERYNRYGMQLLLQIDDGSVCSVPPQWTAVVAPDPEIVIGEQRALFRVVDLVELARLVARLRRRDWRWARAMAMAGASASQQPSCSPSFELGVLG